MSDRVFPPVFGKIIVEGLQNARFWIRVFQLENAIGFAQAKIIEKAERKTGVVPVISEFTVDPDRLRFFYCVSFDVDALGVQDCLGVIYYADKAHAKEAIEYRNKLGHDVMRSLEERRAAGRFQEDFDFEVGMINPGKER